MRRFDWAIAVAGWAMSAVAAAGTVGRMELPALSRAEAWTSTVSELVTVVPREGAAVFRLSLTQTNGAQRLLLKTPVAIPAGWGFFADVTLTVIYPVKFNLLVEDAAGNTFRFYTKSFGSLREGNLIGGVFRVGLDPVGEVRLRAPGLNKPVRDSYHWISKPNTQPVAPFRMLGFELVAEAKNAKTVELILRNARLSAATFANEPFYYQFKGQEFFGTADGNARLYLTDVLMDYAGERFTLDWALCADEDGKPMLSGSRAWVKEAGVPDRASLSRNPVELPRLGAGSYFIQATARTWRKGQVAAERKLPFRYDVFTSDVTNTFPRQSLALPKESSITTSLVSQLPPGVPNAEDIRTGRKLLTLFAPMVADKARQVEYYTQLMDEMVAAGNSHEFEIQTSWKDLEPLPGCYDFAAIDAILDAAAARGLHAFVTFAPLIPPAWMPEHFTMNAEGGRFGHTSYLFNGGRQNLFQSEELRSRALAFLRALVGHVCRHPGLLGYFYICEHSGEAPWADWYEGFDPETKANFRADAKRQYGEIARANAAWKTAFASFEAIEPPVVGDRASLAFRRDWLVFRRGAIFDFMLTFVKTVRAIDPYRIIMLYGDGVIKPRLRELAPYQVITANGGCANVQAQGYGMAVWADAGLPQRAEEITCSIWEGPDFPTRLDVSLFTMMIGGGVNAHFKMFTGQGKRFADIRKPPQGLERFERFIPLREELRAARRVCTDVCAYTDYEGALAEGQTVNNDGMAFGGWAIEWLLDSQVPFISNAADAWKQTKLVVTPPRAIGVLARRDIQELADYVKAGGTLFLAASYGRREIEREEADWVLLRALGFPAPLADDAPDRCFDIDFTKGGGWDDGSVGRIQARGLLRPPPESGEVLMSRADGAPALTRKALGQGRVYVLWAHSLAPYRECYPASVPFLQKIAEAAGVALPVKAGSRLVWTYLLQKGRINYLFAMRDDWIYNQKLKNEPAELHTQIRLPLLKGEYAVREMISGTDESARRFPAEGIDVSLRAKDVRIFRLTPLENKK